MVMTFPTQNLLPFNNSKGQKELDRVCATGAQHAHLPVLKAHTHARACMLHISSAAVGGPQ